MTKPTRLEDWFGFLWFSFCFILLISWLAASSKRWLAFRLQLGWPTPFLAASLELHSPGASSATSFEFHRGLLLEKDPGGLRPFFFFRGPASLGRRSLSRARRWGRNHLGSLAYGRWETERAGSSSWSGGKICFMSHPCSLKGGQKEVVDIVVATILETRA